jgi:hypothetical protein
MSFLKLSNFTGNQTRDLATCSTMPPPTAHLLGRRYKNGNLFTWQIKLVISGNAQSLFNVT